MSSAELPLGAPRAGDPCKCGHMRENHSYYWAVQTAYETLSSFTNWESPCRNEGCGCKKYRSEFEHARYLEAMTDD